jgi:hypothetical protein
MPGLEAFRFVSEVHDDDVLQVRVGQHGLHPLVDGGVEDDGFCVRVVQDVRDLAFHVHGVDLGDDSPEPDGGEEGDHILRTIRQHERDPVPLRDPCRRERGGHLLHQRLEPPELEGRAVEAERIPPAMLLDRTPEQIVQRALEHPRLRLDVPTLVSPEPRSLSAEHVSS